MGIKKILKSPFTYAKEEVKHSFKRRAAFKQAYREAELKEAPEAARELAKYKTRARLRAAKARARRPKTSVLAQLTQPAPPKRKKARDILGTETQAYLDILGVSPKKKRR